MQQFQKVTLATIGGGMASELFDREMKAVMKNIDDINTGPTETRKITLTISFKPNEKRDHAMVTVKCATTLAGVKPVGVPVFMGRDKGTAERAFYQNDMKQEDLPFPRAVTSEHVEEEDEAHA